MLINRFYNTYQFYNNGIVKCKLSLRKRVYPYEYMDTYKKINEPVPLMNETYYSEFNDTNINDSDLEYVKNVCNVFKISDLGSYHDHYVGIHVSLLADVFENFRGATLKIKKLGPAYYLSAPGISWQSCLKKTGVTLELLTDENMFLLYEKGIRGGMCNVVQKYAVANNKYMKNYDNTKDSLFIEYIDGNNLYGWAMYKKLPIDNFMWEQDLPVLTDDFIENYNEDSDKGYLFHVDITYPQEIPELHADQPFLSDKTQVAQVNKLVANVHDKNNCYTCICIKTSIKSWLSVKKVHEVISFREEAWLKPFI